MRLRVLILAGILAAVAAPHAQQTERIAMMGEFVPRYVEAPATLVVKSGQVMPLVSGTWDYIEIQPGGTLKCARTGDTTVKVTTLTNMVGGVFDCGTVQDPITGRVDIVLRDEAFDYGTDPYQWSHGLLNLGTQYRVGADWQKTTFVEVEGDLPAGATEVHFHGPAPTGWNVGDELLFPDMAMPSPNPPGGDHRKISRRESTVTIAAITNTGLTLSKPLDFEHEAAKATDGTVVLRVPVANLTRGHIIVESENAHGVRGHTVNIGEAALWDIRGNMMIDLGRTQAVQTDASGKPRMFPVDSTTADANGKITHVGQNQIARYADHDHHTNSNTSGPRIRDGNVELLHDGAKWGLSIHRADDTIVRRTIIVGAQGAGIVTEDGPEVRNVLDSNIVAYTLGTGTASSETPMTGVGCPGCEGFGYWARGPRQTFVNDQSWDNLVGFALFNRDQLTGQIPSMPGRPLDAPMDPKAIPLAFKGNISIGGQNGLESWSMSKFLIEDSIVVHAFVRQLWLVNSGSYVGTWTKHVTLLGSRGRSTCLTVDAGYTEYAEDEGSRFLDCAAAVGNGISINTGIFKDTTFQGSSFALRFDNPDSPATTTTLDGVRFLSDAAEPSPIIFGPDKFLPPKQKDYGRGFTFQDGTAKQHLINWRGTGKNYRILNVLQRRDTPALFATDLFHTAYMNPECGATMGESWDKCGYAWGGEVYSEDEIEHDPLIVNGVLKPDTPQVLGTPHAVLNVPNPLVPIPAGRATMTLAFYLTGDREDVASEAYWRIDGGAPQNSGVQRSFPPSLRSVRNVPVPNTPGLHTIETWSVDAKKGKEVEGSRLTFHFSVEPALPPVASNAPMVPPVPSER